ncbi:MAG: hypothetical protein ACYS19_08920 [Planctomycetota bacterium]|jgi:hypothetical protein
MAVGMFCWVWNTNKVVSDVQMEAYGKTFLRRYKDLVQSKVFPAYQKYFSFIKEKPILIKASISTSHGAAVEFIPSEAQKFQCQTVTARIEQAVFPNKNLSISRKESNAKPKLMFRVLAKLANFRKIEVTTSSERNFFELSETGSLRTEEIVVDDINYPNTIIIKGSNRRNAWNRKAAKEEALYDFRGDYFFAYLNSEKFREFVATPKLTQIANEIVAKQKAGDYGGDYGYLKKEEDIAMFVAAADAHGIKHEYSENIYEFVKEQPQWRERHPIMFSVICGVVVGILVILLICFFKWGWKWIWVKTSH